MNPLNPFAVSGLFIVVTTGPLFVLLLFTAKIKATKIFNLHLFSILIWGISSFFWATLKDIKMILIVWNIAMIVVIFMPVFFYHTAHLLSNDKNLFKLCFLYIQALFFSICVLSGWLWTEHTYVFNSFYYPKSTWLYKITFSFWLLVIIFGHFKLISYYKIAHPKEKKQIQYLLYSMVGFLGGICNFLPALGIQVYPYGNFFVPFYSFFIAFAILRHQLFEINVVFKKSIVYSILILLISFIYFSIVILCEKFLQGFWGYKSMTISVVTAFVIGILFFPLHNYIQRLVDKLIFKKTTEEISKENEILRAEVLKSEKLKSVAVLASGMAHEIKNPLTALKTFSEYLPNKLDDKEFLQKFSRIVGGEVNRIDELVNELLEFAKPTPLQLKETNVNKLIADTLDFLNSKFLQQKISVKTDFSPECDVPMMLDPNKMRQALLNIILNAIEAMKPGGTLTIGTNPQPLTPNPSIRISITDTGCGIAKDKLITIFDPFYSTKDSGTGLGLPITHGIIKDHGGEIKVESVVGHGTTFTIILPRN